MLYNVRSIIDGLIKILETGCMTPDVIEDTLTKSIAAELSKGDTPQEG